MEDYKKTVLKLLHNSVHKELSWPSITGYLLAPKRITDDVRRILEHDGLIKTTLSTKQGDIVALTSKAIADKYKPQTAAFVLDDIMKDNKSETVQPNISEPTMSKEKEDTKGYVKIGNNWFIANMRYDINCYWWCLFSR